MANRKVGRKRASPPCWTLPFFGAIFVFKVYFLTDDPPEDEPWYAGDNSTDLSVSRVASNDTQVMELFSPDEDLLDMMRSVDGEGATKSLAALVLGSWTFFLCLMILMAYGDMDKVRLKLEKDKC